ncbi:hypothetical protein [Pseudorhodobacter antarcticus]|uniref:hypothetical protein n=1 Tax=Pseudorhodobacter antarcticus TaxID=1077947 RepID=UPI000B2D14C7|nr:hypothetical protein [Pseudorhodobacter antarcticus]
MGPACRGAATTTTDFIGAFGSVAGSDVVFTFGADSVVTLTGLNSLAGLDGFINMPL